jgi:RNA polymerase sigma-70 factor (sigma-E family)
MEAEVVVEGPEPLDHVLTRDAAVAALYQREYVPMVRLAHLITGSNEAAEDVVQEAFVKIYRKWDRADRPGAYLRTVVVNGCRSWLRRRRMERDRLPRPVPDGVDGVHGEARELLDALARLGIRQRTALVLRFYADLSEADVAEALGCRPGTVKSLVHRGLRELERTIER